MIAVGFLIVYLAVAKGFEPLLLIPIGFGTILVNIPGAGMGNLPDGMLAIIYKAGVGNEFFPMLIFMGIGAMTDFGPLIANPKTAILGGAAQFGRVSPTVLPAVCEADFSDILPRYIVSSLQAGIPLLGRKINGFDADDAVLTAPETRSSSPVRVVRGEDYQSLTVRGLYPRGEGAGYAGGILSSAVDGMHCAEAVIAAFV